MGMAALSIDMLLPAFPEMRADLGLAPGSTDISRVITTFFFGIAVGQLVYGPLSDRYGRKPMLYAGLGVFVAGGVASALAPSLGALGVARFVWGLGAAAPRSLAIAMVRDSFEGPQMARTMSFVMTAFLLVPVFAPAVGSAVLAVGPWHLVVWAQVAAAVGLGLWATRLPETLHADDRRRVGPRSLLATAGAVLRTRQTLVYGLAITCIFGLLTSYIGSAEVIIDEVFGEGDRFSLIFGALAATMAIGTLASARLVVDLGLDRLLRLGAVYLVLTAVVLAAVALVTDGAPSLWAFGAAMALLLPAIAVVIPSCNAAAMAPLGHYAGMGAAILGTATTAGGALLGTLTDQAFDGTVTPFALHVLVYSVVAAGTILLLGGVADHEGATVPEPAAA
jgi:DHA1 family bicyclomycin/chloramphenicol resistance-like MFS transporter